VNPALERRLDETAQQLQLARAIEFSAKLLSTATLALLLVGAGVLLGAMTRGWAVALLTLVGAGGFVVWFVAILIITCAPRERAELARETERVNPSLMDRLNTLVALAPRRHSSQIESYAGRIEQQSVAVIHRACASVPLVPRTSRRWILSWLAITACTVLFYLWFQPFSRLSALAQTPDSSPAEPPLEIPRSADEANKQPGAVQPWIEARILEPGRDMVVTRYESVPMRVEAATSGELSRVDLHTARNGAAAPPRPLPAGGDPRFTRHEELIDIEQSDAGDWDVLSYFATAESKDGMTAASRIYFVEVRPLREEIEQLPGGVEGEPYRLLNELTNMIDAQQHTVRAAHRINHAPPDTTSAQTIADLARTQDVMKTAVDYVRGSLPDAAELAPTLEQLNLAADSFKQAAEQFQAGQTKEAELSAQKAIGQLAMARKEIHNAVKAHPDALPGPARSSDPLADLSEQLMESEQVREQLRSAADQAALLAAEQRKLANQIKPCETTAHQQAADAERQLREKFDQFREEQSAACQRAGSQTAAAESALDDAAAAMEQLAAQHDNPKHQQANRAAAGATKALEQLAKSLEQQSWRQQIAQANQLQQAIDQQIKFLEELEQNPDGATQQEIDQATRDMQTATSELKEMAEDPATRGQFSDELREQLSDENKQRLDRL
jgi:hypothetical protein